MVAVHHILSDLAGSQNPVPPHLPRVLPDVAHKAPFFQFPHGASLGEAGQILSTLPAWLLWLLSHGEVAGPWTFSCALYFRHTQTLCSCCQKETKTVPAFWQTNRAKRREMKASWAPSQSWSYRDNSSSVPSRGLLPPGTQTQQGLPLGSPCLVCFLEWGAAHVLKGRQRRFFLLLSGLPRAQWGRSGRDMGRLWDSLINPFS